ncbi:carboxymuconolactone decarboxylase family protein [Oryzomonas japonica]|uniref:Carboxymuconolactone decarboxylase family protein n=1 Tax=Oryzomonas japonica TaxID=2603858 RepID=A0A7J4ZQ92_9BACT|nr:carboxymuconolactone decarboxylase family protein [Oryzomonas japonica]KAB0665041.1 carboxymuconolactone decarboxylase family protein [Oryzomonas japonica]
MLPEQQQKAFGDFYDTVRENRILDPKTTLLLHLGAAMALGCSPCMEYYLGQVEKAGITAEEIGAVQGVVMAVAAGKVNAQLGEVQRRMRKERQASGQCQEHHAKVE